MYNLICIAQSSLIIIFWISFLKQFNYYYYIWVYRLHYFQEAKSWSWRNVYICYSKPHTFTEWCISETSYFTQQHVHCWASGYCAYLIFRFWIGFTQRIKKAKCPILGCSHSIPIVLQCELQSCRIAIRETYFQLNSYSFKCDASSY